MKDKQIWIFVRGGVVNEVRSTHSGIKVNLIDYDNLEVEDDEDERKEIQKQELLSEDEYVIF